MAIHTKISEDNELYVYINGKLIYKRWIDGGYSKVFDKFAYGRGTFVSIVEENGQIKRKKKIFINGYFCETQEQFWDKYCEQIGSERANGFGRNLDAFNDAITGGGPGCPGDAIMEIIGRDKLTAVFGERQFQFIIDVLSDADYIDFTFEK